MLPRVQSGGGKLLPGQHSLLLEKWIPTSFGKKLAQIPHIDIPGKIMHPFARATFEVMFLSPDDRSSPRRGRLVGEFLAEEMAELLSWPAFSPDINRIEDFWVNLSH